MSRRGAVFLDSGAFVAFLDRSDRHHRAFLSLFSAPPPRWCTSLAVVSETYGWFLHRLGEEAARTFRELVASLPGLVLVPLDDDLHDATVRRLESLRGHKLTYVDASSLVILGRNRIGTVWGTDQDLAIDGARLLPGRAA